MRGRTAFLSTTLAVLAGFGLGQHFTKEGKPISRIEDSVGQNVTTPRATKNEKIPRAKSSDLEKLYRSVKASLENGGIDKTDIPLIVVSETPRNAVSEASSIYIDPQSPGKDRRGKPMPHQFQPGDLVEGKRQLYNWTSTQVFYEIHSAWRDNRLEDLVLLASPGYENSIHNLLVNTGCNQKDRLIFAPVTNGDHIDVQVDIDVGSHVIPGFPLSVKRYVDRWTIYYPEEKSYGKPLPKSTATLQKLIPRSPRDAVQSYLAGSKDKSLQRILGLIEPHYFEKTFVTYYPLSNEVKKDVKRLRNWEGYKKIYGEFSFVDLSSFTQCAGGMITSVMENGNSASIDYSSDGKTFTLGLVSKEGLWVMQL